MQALPWAGAKPDREIDGVSIKIGIAQSRFKLDLDVWMSLLELWEMWNQPPCTEGLKSADAQGSRRVIGNLAAGVSRFLQHAFHGSEIAAAGVGEFDRWVAAMEERRPE
ncbi:MAG: hypothetical protein ACI8W3_002064 [Myxococcota bacterium]|jgi:hypothetical protein